jgi:hypothetical protein
VQQIVSALNSGNVITGTGANARIAVDQFASTLGISGKSTEERLQNTRVLMQGLAKSELGAAEQMKGQGQITERERDLIRRAAAGEVTMTTPELRSLAMAIDKTARGTIRAAQQNAQRLESNPNARAVTPFLQSPEPPPIDMSAPSPAQQTQQWGIRRLP